MAKVVPVTVLTGFLGAGKTTLLNHILRSPDHGLRFAIIENELGAVSVDDKVLPAKAESSEEIVEVMNGCICCRVRSDLVVTLKKMHRRVRSFDAVIIETTGLADPAPVVQTFCVDDEIKAMYKLDGIITVVDAKHVLIHLDEQKAAGTTNETAEQLAFADRVLLNKTDLVEDPAQLDTIVDRIKAINEHVPIFRCQHSKVDPKLLINLGCFDLDRVLKMDPEFLEMPRMTSHDKSVSSASCKFQGEVHVMKLQQWINELLQTKAEDLFRYKGVVAVKGMDAKFVFQGVHMLFNGRFTDTMWREDEVRECRFVFIGRNLDKEALVKGVLACKLEGELRFKVGDEVMVKVDDNEWRPGNVIKHWDQGNPYRVQVKGDEDFQVWAPMDEDLVIQAMPSGS